MSLAFILLAAGLPVLAQDNVHITIHAAPWFPPSRDLAAALAEREDVRFVWDGTQTPGAARLEVADEVVWTGHLPAAIAPQRILDSLESSDPAASLHEATALPDGPTAAQLNAKAWRLLTDVGTKAARKEARKLAERAVTMDRSPAHLDTLARAWWDSGRKKKALDLQREALSTLSETSSLYAAVLGVLNDYERELGLPATPGPPWRSTINAAFDTGENVRSGSLVEPLQALSTRFGGRVETDLDALSTGALHILYGSPAEHPALARVLSHHRIQIDEDRVTIGDHKLPAEAPFVIASLPHPEQPDRPVMVYAAHDNADAHRLNGVFHGPTALVVGSIGDDGPSTLYAGPGRLDEDGRLMGISTCQGDLSADAVIDDLLALEAQLVSAYAGFEDLDRRLTDTGGWAAHRDAVVADIRAQGTLSCELAFLALDQRLLAPVVDTHFTFEGRTTKPDGSSAHRRSRHVESGSPWFAEGLLRKQGEGHVFGPQATPWDSLPPIVPDPENVELDAIYRFPTLAPDGTEAWLVGSFRTARTTPPPLTWAGQSLPLHDARGRKDTSRSGPFSLSDKDGVPVLSVTTMNPTRLDGLTDTVEAFADLPLGILDLRGNTGGSDRPATEWVSALHDGTFLWPPGADLKVSDGPRNERWTAWGSDRVSGRAHDAHNGRLYVLIDPRVASSGETFAQLAAQLPDAVLVGHNTAGCSEYGNVQLQAPLPHTGFQASFGHTRFVWSEVRPVTEGRGLFPDLWLDDNDPVDFVLALPRQ